jgi:hypothetical protein
MSGLALPQKSIRAVTRFVFSSHEPTRTKTDPTRAGCDFLRQSRSGHSIPTDAEPIPTDAERGHPLSLRTEARASSGHTSQIFTLNWSQKQLDRLSGQSTKCAHRKSSTVPFKLFSDFYRITQRDERLRALSSIGQTNTGCIRFHRAHIARPVRSQAPYQA